MTFENIQPETESIELPVATLTQAERRKLEGRKSLPQLFAESPFKGLNIEFDESISGSSQ